MKIFFYNFREKRDLLLEPRFLRDFCKALDKISLTSFATRNFVAGFVLQHNLKRDRTAGTRQQDRTGQSRQDRRDKTARTG
jgi:hypothetical protein